MSRGQRLTPWVIASGAYTALAVLMTWPLVTQLSSAFPHDAFDPALNAWILWWNTQALPLTARWWNAPSFWPVTGALTFSEHLLGISLVSTPLLRLGVDPVATYNIVLLLSYPLTALATHALAFALVRRHGPAILAALIMGFSPYRIAQLPHLQMLWAFGMPLALLAAHRYLDDGARAWLIAFGAAWLVLALSNSYYLLFFPVLLGPWILWFGRGSPRRAAAIVVTWVVASLPLVPILLSYATIHRTLNLTRRFDEIESFGADLAAIVTTAPAMLLWRPLSIAGRGEGQLFPGSVALALLVAGLVVLWRSSERPSVSNPRWLIAGRRVLVALVIVGAAIAISPLAIGAWQLPPSGRPFMSVSSPEKPLTVVLILAAVAFVTSPRFADLWRRQSVLAFYAFAAVLMWGFSWGPHPRLNGAPILFRGPYALLLRLPGLAEVRVPARFGMLVVLCLAVAAAVAFARFTASLSIRARGLLATLAAAAVIAESWPAITVTAVAVPITVLQIRAETAGSDQDQISKTARSDPDQIPRQAPVLELPLGESWLDAPAQFRGIAHGRPVVNGYSGYAPPHYRLLSIALRLDDGDVLRGLTTTTPLVVALNKHEEPDRWRRVIEAQHGERVADDPGFEIYRLPANTSAAASASDPPLPVTVTDASAGADGARYMLDGDLETVWNSQQVQRGGEFIVIDLGRDRHVSAIKLTSGPFVSDYPRRLAVDCAADGRDGWTPCWSGSIAGLLLRSLLDDAPTAAAAIPLNRDGVRRIRLTQTAVDPLNGWSIAELAVLGR